MAFKRSRKDQMTCTCTELEDCEECLSEEEGYDPEPNKSADQIWSER